MDDNYKVILVVDNFQSNSKKLIFDDFFIEAIKPGSEGKTWRTKLHTKNVPEYILVKEYLNYYNDVDDISGYDNIMNDIMNLLLVFRLFKIGDIFFNEMMIENIDSEKIVFSQFQMDNFSSQKYIFDKEFINRFIIFKNTTKEKLKSNNKYLYYPLGQFLKGCNKTFLYKKEATSRIVDYVVALESLFLVDDHHWFLRRTLSKRVEYFLEEDDISGIIKFMYDERSRIVHGSYIDLNKSAEEKMINKIKKNMIPFECIMRKTLLKMLNINFNSKDEIKKYMQSLYTIPEEVIKVMNTAKTKSEKILSNSE